MKSVVILSVLALICICSANKFLAQPETPILGGLEDYVWKTPRDQLVQWALSAESYYREKKNIKVLGGLHDYIDSLTNEEIAETLIRYSRKLPELNSAEFLNSLSAPKLQAFGGLHDYIFRAPREDLMKWALACEAYHNEKTNTTILGGLHDYIDKLGNVKIAQIVLDYAEKHPELNSLEGLNKISAPKLKAFGGLHDYIFRTPRADLVRWALACEDYDRKQRNVTLLGGLHDYIHSLNNTEIAQIVLKYAETYPQLASAESLNKISKPKKMMLSKRHTKGGLHDYIFRMPRETLIQWALNSETYIREKKGQVLIGGLHDYIHNLSNQEIARIVLEFAKEHPELNSAEALNKLSKKEA